MTNKKNKDYIEIFEDESIVRKLSLNEKENKQNDKQNNFLTKSNKIDNSNKNILLPSEKEKLEKLKKKRREKNLKVLKWSLIIIFAIVIYLFYDTILLKIFHTLKQNPTLYSYYLYIQEQITNNTKIGLFILSTLGSLFFLALPSEALFIYFLENVKYNFFIIFLITIGGNLFGLTINYFFGLIFGERVIRFLFKKKFFSYKEKIHKWGGLILFVGNIFPGPIEVLSVFYGGFRFSFKRYLYLSFMGRLIKYILLFLIYYFYWTDFLHIINTIKLFFKGLF